MVAGAPHPPALVAPMAALVALAEVCRWAKARQSRYKEKTPLLCYGQAATEWSSGTGMTSDRRKSWPRRGASSAAADKAFLQVSC
uniref:Uncharacterized protein n=1 Tax=Sphaerodactylus townsendi TaxID=933632 RepID=A0ACB8EKK6_9SAUR